MRKFVSLRAVSRSQDGTGEAIETFTEYATAYCSITPLRGSEQISGDQQSARQVHSIILRYNSSIKATDRVVYTGCGGTERTFEINFPRNIDEMNHWMELLCTEVKDS
jgi:SPP1 family predicted phage head-tail adaptor